MKPLRVYIAGPYTKGDVAVNVRNAIIAGQEVLEAGHLPYIPHLTHFWHMVHPGPYEQWIKMDLGWLPVCDVLIRLLGDSTGADGEVHEMIVAGKTVLYGMEEWRQYLRALRVVR